VVAFTISLQQTDGWPWQLLSVACLSLAAKMEEPLVPSLLDLQVFAVIRVIFNYDSRDCIIKS
jgi:hypothetical protein